MVLGVVAFALFVLSSVMHIDAHMKHLFEATTQSNPIHKHPSAHELTCMHTRARVHMHTPVCASARMQARMDGTHGVGADRTHDAVRYRRDVWSLLRWRRML